jgi:hypothetical protein
LTSPPIRTLEKLQELLEVRSFLAVGPTTPQFTELIVYTDHGTGTQVRFRITERANPVGARYRWQTFGVTPWAWRYVPGPRGHPHLDFVLGRRAELETEALDAAGQPVPFPPRARHEQVHFSEYLVDRVSDYQVRTLFCVPRYSISRPQVAFLPPTERPDQHFDLGTTSQVYYPRSPRDAGGAVLAEPVAARTPEQLVQQVWRRRGSGVPPRSHTLLPGSEYVITSTGTGHQIRSVYGEYAIAISIDDLHRPADYNFTFASRRREVNLGPLIGRIDLDEIDCYVHHGPNVTVTAQAPESAFILNPTVQVLREPVVGAVEPFGDPLPDRSRFVDLDDSNAVAQVLYAVGTLALALIPGWGWIAALALSVGEFVYAYHTEKDFLGNKVSPNELAAMGLLGIVGTAGDVLGALRVGRATVSIAPELDDALRLAAGQARLEFEAAERGSLAAVDVVGDQPVAKLVASLPPAQLDRLEQLGLAGLDADQYLRRAGALLAEHMSGLQRTDPDQFQAIVVAILNGLLTPEGDNFVHEGLRRAYEVFRTDRRTTRRLAPIRWLTESRSKPVVEFLGSVLGPDYRRVIRAAETAAAGKAVVIATADNIELVTGFFDRVARLGLTPYRELDAIRALPEYDAVRGLLKDCFQFEHPVELRFARNLNGRQHYLKRGGRWKLDPSPLGIDVEQRFQAVVVARTPRHAQLLRQSRGARPTPALGYTQHPKTGRVAAWIPHGAEHHFTPQQMADVICAQLLELNADQLARNANQFDRLLDRLSVDFEQLTEWINEARGTRYPVPRLTRRLADVNPALRPGGSGWPRVRRRNGVWAVTNQAEADRAQEVRKAWAEGVGAGR